MVIAEIINCICETFVIVLFYNRIFEKRKSGIFINSAEFILFVLINLSRSFLYIRVSLNWFFTGIWCIIIGVFMFKGSRTKRLIAAAVYMIILVLTDLLISSIFSYVFNNPLNNGFVIMGYYRYVFSAAFLLVNFLATQIVSVFFTKKYQKLPVKYSVMFVAVPIICGFATICLMRLMVQLTPVSLGNMLMILFIIVCLAIFNVILYDFIDNYGARVRLAETEEIIRVHDENYKMMRLNEQELRELRHNIQDYMNVMTELLENGKTEDTTMYFKRLKQASEKVTSRVYTKDAEIDSVLNVEGKKAMVDNIKYTVKTRINEDVHIDVVDKSTLLCNLINNAIEGCRNCNEKFVAVTILSDKNSIKITVENSSDIENADKKSWYTTKSNNTIHGYGMGIIKEIVNKYNGAFDIRCENKIVTANVIIRNGLGI